MEVVHCFVWPLALQLWSVRQAGKLADKNMGSDDIFKMAACKCFLFLMLCLILNEVRLFCKGYFCPV